MMTEENYNTSKTAPGLDIEIEDGINGDHRSTQTEDNDSSPSCCSGFFECFLGRPNDKLNDSEVEKQHVRDIYFSFGVVLMAGLAGIILPDVAYRIGNGLWKTQCLFTEKVTGLEAHAWLAFISVFVLIVQAATGPLLNNKTYGRTLKKLHAVDGWFGIVVLAALTMSGCAIAGKYWQTQTNTTMSLGQLVFGIMIFFMVVGGAISVKVGRIDVHKDAMFGVICWSFFGAGATRWMAQFLRELSGGCSGPILSDIQYGLNFCIFQPLLLGAVYYRANRLTKWWNILIIAGSFVTAIAGWVGNAIAYDGNYPTMCN